MEKPKKNYEAEAFLDRLWEKAKKEALDGNGVYGKFGVLFEVHDSTFVQATPHFLPVVRMPRVSQHA